MRHLNRTATAALLLGVSDTALSAQVVPPTAPPEPPVFDAQGEPVFVNRDEIFTCRALDGYSATARAGAASTSACTSV